MKVFSTLLMATLALALVLVASASAATVGGGTAVISHDGPDEFGRAWAACLETRDANSDECSRAQELSGLGAEEFFDKLMRKLSRAKPAAASLTRPTWVATRSRVSPMASPRRGSSIRRPPTRRIPRRP